MNLRDGDWIKEAFDEIEYAAETPGCVDDVQPSQPLGIVVLRDGGCLLDISVDRRHAADADPLHIHDSAAGFQQLAGFPGAGGETGVGDFFVFNNEILQHAVGGRDFVHGVEIDFAVVFYINRSTILLDVQRGSSRCKWAEAKKQTYLVSLMVVLRIIFEHLGFLGVLEGANEIVGTELFAPLLIVDEPESFMSV